MNALTITFINREFCVGLWISESSPIFMYVNDAIEDLSTAIQELLKSADVSIDAIEKIGLLVGPGSFTSIRIAICTVLAIQALYPDKIYVPMQMQDIIGANMPIAIKCGHKMYNVYQNNAWKMCNKNDVLALQEFATIDSIDLDDIGDRVIHQIDNEILQHRMRDKLAISTETAMIKPFYGLEI